MSSDFNFTVTSWFLGNVRVKPYFNTQWYGNRMCAVTTVFNQLKQITIFLTLLKTKVGDYGVMTSEPVEGVA